MDSYNKFLAEKVLTEDRIVTYRLLSRALQIHVNTAKQVLYEFHRSQNARRPGAVHATYLVYGTKAAESPSTVQNGSDGDIEMTCSAPEAESVGDTVRTFTVSLVPEERLKEALAEYEEVSSIHVYSIAPHPSKDHALLVDAASEVSTLETGNDRKNLVAITNPRVRRRERQGAGLKAAAATTTAVKQQAKPEVSKTTQSPAPGKVKEEPKPAQPAQAAPEKTGSSVAAKKPAPPPKRGATSGIMQAFSKAATKVKKEAEAPKPATPSGEDDAGMQALSDDGEDDSGMPEPAPRHASGFKSKKQREEELRRMMEEDDDDDEDEASERAETPADEPMEEEPPAPEPAKEEEETEVVTASANGRRRGRRRVMRKKQIMDKQGYLVTIQEPGWESFSEDEAPPPTKPKSTSTAPPAQAAKPKKGGQKGSQGSIMSFFSKK